MVYLCVGLVFTKTTLNKHHDRKIATKHYVSEFVSNSRLDAYVVTCFAFCFSLGAFRCFIFRRNVSESPSKSKYESHFVYA